MNATITVSADALRTTLQALVGQPHEIRELQMTRGSSPLGDRNPIDRLIDEFNAGGIKTETQELKVEHRHPDWNDALTAYRWRVIERNQEAGTATIEGYSADTVAPFAISCPLQYADHLVAAQHSAVSVREGTDECGC